MSRFIASALVAAAVSGRDQTGDGKLTFQELCTKYGFQFQSHTVTTEDGYILTQYRIRLARIQ